MKKRTKITGFAKLVIAVLIFLGLRYAYLHREEILSSDLFKLSDTSEHVDNMIDTINIKNITEVDTNIMVSSDSLKDYTDTIEFQLKNYNNLLYIHSENDSIRISLDSVKSNDTVLYKVLKIKILSEESHN